MSFKIQTTAVSLFDIWVTHTKQHYSAYSFQASNDTLGEDLKVALAKALEQLWRNENQTKRDIPEWSVKFVVEVVSSNLNTHWSQEYIYKQTPEYKELFFLKVLSQYLKMDAVAIQKIEALYKHLMSKETKIIEQECITNEKIIDFEQFKKDRHPDNTFKNKMINYFDSIFFEKYFLIFGDILKNNHAFILTDFFKTEEIKQLIESVNRSD